MSPSSRSKRRKQPPALDIRRRVPPDTRQAATEKPERMPSKQPVPRWQGSRHTGGHTKGNGHLRRCPFPFASGRAASAARTLGLKSHHLSHPLRLRLPRPKHGAIRQKRRCPPAPAVRVADSFGKPHKAFRLAMLTRNLWANFSPASDGADSSLASSLPINATLTLSRTLSIENAPDSRDHPAGIGEVALSDLTSSHYRQARTRPRPQAPPSRQ